MRVLIIKPTALGDVAAALALVGDLGRAMPGAEIDWVVHPAYAALVEGHVGVRRVIRFDRKKLAAWWWRPSAFRAFWGLMSTLRRNRYDVVIDAQGLFRSGFLARVTGARVRVGFADAREGARLAYTQRVALPEGGRRMVAVERMRALAGALGADVSGAARFDVPVGEAARARALELVPETGEAFVAVIPGARWDTKRWPAGRYAEIVRRLAGEGQRVVLVGSPEEKGLCDEIEKGAGGGERVINLAGRTDVGVMVAVLARAGVVMGNDSGPLHVAVALGRKVVALYGPTAPAFVGPYGQMGQVLREEVACHPCRRRECDHHSCMAGLTVERVWEKTALTVRGVAVGK